MRKKAFNDLAEYRAERALIKARVRSHEVALKGYRDLLKDHEFRHELVASTVDDLVGGLKPMRVISNAFRSDSGRLSTVIAGLLGSRVHTLRGKVITWALALVVAKLLKVLGNSEFFKQAINGMRATVEEELEEVEDSERKSDLRPFNS